MELKVSQIEGLENVRLLTGDAQRVLRGASIDSREVARDDLFVCFPGERVDGNDFCESAIASGAGCVAMTREPAASELEAARTHGAAIVLLTRDPEGFLQEVATLWRDANPHWLVVGITGSVGKTTTRLLTESALSPAFRVHATKANYNSGIGSALTVLAAPAEAGAVLVEMGMDHAGEILPQSCAVKPNIAIITNIGSSHLANFDSRDDIAHAKAEILCGLEPSEHLGCRKYLVMCGEDDYVDLLEREYVRPTEVELMLVGEDESDAIRSTYVELDGRGCADFGVRYPDGEELSGHLSIPGKHAVADALLALGAAEVAGVSRAEALAAVCERTPFKMRLEAVETPGRPRVIDDSYNAAPASVKAALEVLAAMDCAGRRVAVLGQMAELGSDEAALHHEVGEAVVRNGADLLVAIGKTLAHDLVEGARAAGMGADAIVECATVEDAIERVIPMLTEDDLVLVKASRSSGLDVFAKEVTA